MATDKSLANKLVAAGASATVALAATFLVVPWEGSVKSGDRFATYKDAVGIPTTCWGQTGFDHNGVKIQMGKTYSYDECVKMLLTSMNSFEKSVDDKVKVDYSSPYQKAALVSFTYNVGSGNLASSTLLRKLNAGKHSEACEELTKWVYAKKQKLKGLVNRRADEMQWCLGNAPYEAKELYIQLAEAKTIEKETPNTPVVEEIVSEKVEQEQKPNIFQRIINFFKNL